MSNTVILTISSLHGDGLRPGADTPAPRGRRPEQARGPEAGAVASPLRLPPSEQRMKPPSPIFMLLPRIFFLSIAQ